MTLDQLRVGESAVIREFCCGVEIVQRLLEFGLLEGDEVTLLAVAPLGDPLEILVGSSRVSLRKADAAGIRIVPKSAPNA